MREERDSTSRPAAKVSPGFLQSAGLVLFYFAASLAASALVFAATRSRQPGSAGVLAIYLLSMSATLALAYRLSRAKLAEVFPVRAFDFYALPPLLMVIAGAAVLLAQAVALVNKLIPMPEEFAEFFRSFEGSSLLLVLGVVVAPVLEETLFRGVILRGLLSRHGVATAVAGDALLFACTHANPWQFIPALLLGTLSSWLFVRARSLTPCVVAHAAWNALYFGLAYAAKKFPRGTPVRAGRIDLLPWWLNACGLLLVGLGVWGLAKRTSVSKNGLTTPARADGSAD